MKSENIQSSYGSSFCPAFCLLYLLTSEDFLATTAGCYSVLSGTQEVRKGINTLFHKTLCDKCTWNLNQASNVLAKGWAVDRPRTPLVSICSPKTHKAAQWHCDNQYIGAWNTDHAGNTRIAGDFSKNHLSRSAGSYGLQEVLMHTFPIACNLTARQWVYPKWAFLQLSLLGSHGCMVISWTGTPLEFGPRDRDLWQISGKWPISHITLYFHLCLGSFESLFKLLCCTVKVSLAIELHA